MGFENTATFIDSLNESWPLLTDSAVEGYGHMNIAKGALTRTFSKISGEVSASTGAINYLKDITQDVQTLLDDTTHTLNVCVRDLTFTYINSFKDMETATAFVAGTFALNNCEPGSVYFIDARTGLANNGQQDVQEPSKYKFNLSSVGTLKLKTGGDREYIETIVRPVRNITPDVFSIWRSSGGSTATAKIEVTVTTYSATSGIVSSIFPSIVEFRDDSRD